MARPLTIIFIVVLILGYFIFTPTYRTRYYYSWDGRVVMTRIIRSYLLSANRDIYFTPGKFDKSAIPTIYVKPKPASVSHGEWVQTIIIHDKGVVITGSDAETKGIDSSFLYYPHYFTDYSVAMHRDSFEKTLQNKKFLTVHSFDD